MPKRRSSSLIDPRYCCCAVPLVNTGIYAIIVEQAVIGVTVGVLALATPDVVGAAFPTFAKVIFAIVCFVVTGCQPVGFIGVLREKTSTFKFYSLINSLAITAAFSTAAALIIVSATRHDAAVTKCESDYFTSSNTTASTAISNTLTTEGRLICSPFAWADVGIMGGLWLILFIVQGYFIYITRTYSVSQVSDHKLYHSVYSENPEAFTMSVLRSTRYNPGSVYNAAPPPGPNADAWDPRPSMDEPGPMYYDDNDGDYGHQREYSDATVRAGDNGRYQDGYDTGSHGQYGGYAHQDQYDRGGQGGGQYPFTTPGGGYIDHPAEARSRDPGQTPTLNHYDEGNGVGWSGGGGNSGLRRPEDVYSHPAEGMFGRKSPRMT